MPQVPSADRLVHQRVDTLTRRLEQARKGEAESVHQARVATRRLREALPLLPSKGRRRRVAATVRKLTRALGPVRELDVSLEGLAELEQAHPQWRAALAMARDVMDQDRRAALQRAVKRIDKWDPARVRKAARPRASVSGVAGPTRADRLILLRRRAALRAEQLRAAIEHAAGIYLPDRLHEVRIAVKKLRYGLETRHQLGARAGTTRASARPSLRSIRGQIAAVRQAQDLLGRLHDHEMLIMRLRAVQGALEGPGVQLAGDLEAAVRFLEMECRRLHGSYMALRPRLLDVSRRVAAAAPPRRRRAA